MKAWNEALLYVGGYLARTIYEHELLVVAQDKSHNLRGMYALQFFNFKESVPDRCVSDKTRDAFFSCSPSPLPIISSLGVRSACDVRLYNAACAVFITKIPMLPERVSAEEMLKELQKKYLRQLDLADVMYELAGERILNEPEMEACLQWVSENAKLTKSGTNLKPFLDAARFSSKGSQHIICLSAIRKVLVIQPGDRSFIPLQSQLSAHTLPYSISQNLPIEELMKLFSWTKFTIIDWLDSLISPTLLEPNTRNGFDESFFSVLSNTLTNISGEEKEDLRRKLQEVACVPTQLGMRRPRESFLYDLTTASFLDVPMAKIGPASKALVSITHSYG